jgi:hypothetical protein
MPKNKTGKKWSVIRDELNIKGGGVYCFFPFEKLDKNKKGIFKVGMTNDFNKRVDGGYHTYFPLGVYLEAFLIEPPLPRVTRANVKNRLVKDRKDDHFKIIEKFIFERLVHNGGKQIFASTRSQNAGDDGKGSTEWFYASEEQIHESFRDAEEKFGGELRLFNLSGLDPNTGKFVDINDKAKQHEKDKPNYVGQIVFHT